MISDKGSDHECQVNGSYFAGARDSIAAKITNNCFFCLWSGLCLLLFTMFCILELHVYKFEGSTSVGWVYRQRWYFAFIRDWLKSDSKAGHWWTNNRAKLCILTNKMVDYSYSQPSDILPLEEEEGNYYSSFNSLYSRMKQFIQYTLDSAVFG